jgi:hypothetical protein
MVVYFNEGDNISSKSPEQILNNVNTWLTTFIRIKLIYDKINLKKIFDNSCMQGALFVSFFFNLITYLK